MVKATIVNFDVVYRGTLDWRVSINGKDELTPFSTRETCAAAARVRARRHHQDHGVSTRVGSGCRASTDRWKPSFGTRRPASFSARSSTRGAARNCAGLVTNTGA